MLLTIEPIKEKLITSMGNLEEIDPDGMDVVGGRQQELYKADKNLLDDDRNLLDDDRNLLDYDKMITMNKEKWLKPDNIKNEVETDSEWLNKMFNTNRKLMNELLNNLIISIDKTLEKLYEEDDIKEINKLLMNDNNDRI